VAYFKIFVPKLLGRNEGKKLNQDSECRGQESNQEPSKYKSHRGHWNRTILPVDSCVGQTGVDCVRGIAVQAVNYCGLCCLTI
jgi:hypothetical protein